MSEHSIQFFASSIVRKSQRHQAGINGIISAAGASAPLQVRDQVTRFVALSVTLSFVMMRSNSMVMPSIVLVARRPDWCSL